MSEQNETKSKSIFTIALEWVVIVIMFTLTIDVIWGVFSRYVIGRQSQWTDELATTLLIWVAMLGAALAYAEHKHLGIDYLVLKCSSAVRSFLEIFTHILVIAFAGTVMIYGGFNLCFARYDSGQMMAALGVSKAYFYLAVPIAGLFIVGYAAHNIYTIFTQHSPSISEHQIEDVD
ncbi:2,3-diketo-L-gulonate TRAP transporter small permease protein YiaM [Poriferisphaera corsica]|uniref:2,3-diketo-L-gulonate TRAP transporter small permease protein YiaM n=1 Tax=Poriferisphaera corsica TaxID=2528020 RepID=A0A517YW11_9BACT|nr:TRAP transporter small permease [Poriferisphaera corsica]QDU34415.1 2,3-diketo-L-gulonate TRAP transporter small permease protein YiaM [Poriferisphaera corsica]